jgi:DNA polymerase-3 subunit epsilon
MNPILMKLRPVGLYGNTDEIDIIINMIPKDIDILDQRTYYICIENYNAKVKEAIASLGEETPTYVIRDKGRHFNEEAFVLVKDGRYQGFGYVDIDVPITSVDDYEPFLKLQEATYHTHKILSNYLRKQGAPKMLFFDDKALRPGNLKILHPQIFGRKIPQGSMVL